MFIRKLHQMTTNVRTAKHISHEMPQAFVRINMDQINMV